MKRFFSLALAVITAVGTISSIPFKADAANTIYELENGVITDTGDNTTDIISISGASGGRAVDLKDSGDAVSIDVNAESGESHILTIRYSQPYDEAGKYQNVIVNGQNLGQIFCAYTGEGVFSTAEISANLKKGSNNVKIEGSWGWTVLDCLTVEERGIVSDTISKKLSNPDASAETVSLYSFLCDTYGNYVISGQQESTWMGSVDYEMNIIQNASGRLPVLRGLDYMGDDFSGCNQRAKDWFEKGGIVEICWHCGSDFSGSHTESLETNLDWSRALTEGTNEYNALIAGMDKGAKALKELQEAGIPVIWRPFHEFDGQWFWWGKGGAENFKKLWRIMYDRYTNYWGLNNLIWTLGYSGETKDGWYPGDEYVDIVGADTYVDHTDSLVNMYQNTADISDKPVCLHENGPVPDPDKLEADSSKWLWFMTWHTSFVDNHAINTAEYLNKVYNSDYVLTLDEIPDIYNYHSSDEDRSGIKGDINNDGAVNVADAVLLEGQLLGRSPLLKEQAQPADINDDKLVDIFDMVMMRKLLTRGS